MTDSNTTSVSCPHCGQSLLLPKTAVGGRCWKCTKTFRVVKKGTGLAAVK